MNKIVIALLMLLGICTSVSAQKYQRYVPATDMYLFGVCFSAADSTVYFTEIKQVPNTSVERGTGFLYSRSEYSGQLQRHVRSAGSNNYTAVVCYAKKRAKLERKYSKMRQKYQKNHFLVKYIDNSFAFNPISYSDAVVSDEK